MFNLFKRNTEDKPLDVKVVRAQVLQFIKEELQKSEGGEGANIHALQFFAAPVAVEKHLYEAAVYITEPGKFKQEVQRIADDFAVNLPPEWKLEIRIQEILPSQSIKYNNLPLSLIIETTPAVVIQEQVIYTTACLKVMSGSAEKMEYTITKNQGRINLGREKNAATSNGAIRMNFVAFPEDPANAGNKFVSRQHAHLEWDDKKGGFMLYADEGGVPPGNKTKVQSEGEESQVKLNSTQIGHFLKDGDQIILGESVVLQFNCTT